MSCWLPPETVDIRTLGFYLQLCLALSGLGLSPDKVRISAPEA